VAAKQIPSTNSRAAAAASLAAHPSQSASSVSSAVVGSTSDSKQVPKINGVAAAAAAAATSGPLSAGSLASGANSPPTPSQTLGLPGTGRVAKGNSLSLLLPPSSPMNLGLGSSRNKKAQQSAVGRIPTSPLLAQIHRLGDAPSHSNASNGPPSHSRRPSIGMRMSPRGISHSGLDHTGGDTHRPVTAPGTPVPGLPTDPKELKKFFEEKILSCRLCEDPSKFVDVWCMECFFDIDGDHNDPMVYCAECDKDMHKPTNKSKHKRKPFGQYYGEMRTATELGVVAIPDGLPPLCVIQCRNCEEVDKVPTVW
jgi:hypothetical protein